MTPENALAALSAALEAATAAAAARVVRVVQDGRAQSGLVWSDGRVATAEETLGGDAAPTLTRPDGGAAPAEIAGRDPSTDLALLRAEVSATPWIEAPTPAPGALALVVGRGEDGPIAAFGVVSETGPAWTSAAGGRIDARIRLSFALPHAMEGGAALDAEGRLIGLAVADPRRRTLVIPAATLARAAAAIEAKGYVGRGYLGLGLRPIRGGGLIVVDVEADGPGAAAGLMLGDVLASWDGAPLGGMRDLARRLGPDAVGRSATLGIVRAGAGLEVALVVGERPRKG